MLNVDPIPRHTDYSTAEEERLLADLYGILEANKKAVDIILTLHQAKPWERFDVHTRTEKSATIWRDSRESWRAFRAAYRRNRAAMSATGDWGFMLYSAGALWSVSRLHVTAALYQIGFRRLLNHTSDLQRIEAYCGT